jgi:predicted SnoaL-like aldol condensation-catalyzing enzyme
MQIYGFDKTMAPEGKGVIKVELVSSYSYWKKLYSDRKLYDEEKQKVSEQVISALEPRFAGIKGQIEAVDVPTLMTWERYMGGTHGFAGMPNRKANIIKSLIGKGQETTLPGLSGFYLVGQWVTSAGALFSNALSGRNVIKTICKQEGRKFMQKIALAFVLSAVVSIVAAYPVCAAERQQQKVNKKVVLEFYEQAINRKDFESASKYLGTRYLQHNQRAADGREGLKGFVQYLRDKYPNAHSDIMRVFTDGDHVILHVHAVREPGTRGVAIVDIFRLLNGKIVEHWDVHEDILDKAANSNGMF